MQRCDFLQIAGFALHKPGPFDKAVTRCRYLKPSILVDGSICCVDQVAGFFDR